MRIGIFVARWYVSQLVHLAEATDNQAVYEELVEVERRLADLL